MSSLPENPKPWSLIWRAFSRAWRPLVFYELLVSLLATALAGPLLAGATAWLVGMNDDTALGNWEVARFLMSPAGLGFMGLTAITTLVVLFVQYAGLVLVSHAALHGQSVSLWQILLAIGHSLPALVVVAAYQIACASLAALPFVLATYLTYRGLLGEADINYYVDQRPPQFWAAAAVGVALAAGLALVLAWFLARWVLAVPLIVVEGHNWASALRESAARMRGRAGRLILALAVWLLSRSAMSLVALAGLDYLNHAILERVSQPLGLVVWVTLGLLLVDAITVQLLSALFAILLALLIAATYDAACPATATLPPGKILAAVPAPTGPRHVGWLTVLGAALLVIGPVVNLAYALSLVDELFDERPTLVTAHRAGPSQEPENSIAALRLAIAAGADFAEIDVQPTADGKVVLLHDRDLRRVTGDPRDLADVTLDQLAKLRLRAGDRPTDSQIPTLSALIDAAGDRLRLNIELKEFGRSQDLPAGVVGVLREQGFLGRAIVSSFEMNQLAEIRRLEPELPIGLIVSAIKGDITRLNVDFLSVNRRLVRGDLVRRAHQRGLQVHVWTVNDRETALRMLDLGCDNLITSDPALVRQVVDEHAALGDGARVLLRLRRWLRE